METPAEPPASNEATKPIINYSPAEAEIAVLKEKYGALKANTPEGYDQVSRALREVVSTRTQIEARRKQLKEDSLAWGRQVDIAAKKLQALVAEVETPLRAEKDRVDAEKEAKARAIVEAEKARVAELERQVREKEEAERKAARDAQEARLKAAKPDLTKIRNFGDYLDSVAVSIPLDLKHQGAKDFLSSICQRIYELAKECKSYTFKKGA